MTAARVDERHRPQVPDLLARLEPLHPRNNTFPGEVFLRLAADALSWGGVCAADPLSLEETRERFPPEWAGRGRDRWQADDFWQFAALAAVTRGGASPRRGELSAP